MADGMLDASNITPDRDQKVNPDVEKLQAHKKVLRLIERLAEKHPELAQHLNQHISIAAGNVISAISSVPLDALSATERLEELVRQVKNISFWEFEIEHMEKRLDEMGETDPDRQMISHTMTNRLDSLYNMVNRLGIDTLREYSEKLKQSIQTKDDGLTVEFLTKAIERAERRSREN